MFSYRHSGLDYKDQEGYFERETGSFDEEEATGEFSVIGHKYECFKIDIRTEGMTAFEGEERNLDHTSKPSGGYGTDGLFVVSCSATKQHQCSRTVRAVGLTDGLVINLR